MEVNNSQNENQSISISMQNEGDTSNSPDFSSFVPDDYKEKPYMQGIDSFDSLFKQFDNAQSLIGRKTIGIPSADSSKEEWDQFYSKVGRPESFDKYEFESLERPEGMPSRTKEAEDQLKQTFFELGLTSQQAKELLKRSDTFEVESYKSFLQSQQDQNAAKDAEFARELDKLFGSKKSEKIELANKILDKYTPQPLKESLIGLDDKTMLLLAGVINSMYEGEVKEDSFFGRQESNPGLNLDGLQEQARKLMMSDEFRNPMHANHDITRKKVSEMYQQINRLKSGQVKK